MKTVVAIPARLKSTRFPRKVLADIHGKPMLWHVCQGVSQAKMIDEIWVLTDSEEVYEAAGSWGIKTVMTAEDCPSGTDRIASVVSVLDAEIIVNVQGDEPTIAGSVVDLMVSALQDSDADMVTPVFPITDPAEITDPNLVKVVRASNGDALYFSRSPVPYVRDVTQEQWPAATAYWGHVGVYGYRRGLLEEFPSLPEGRLEKAEKLEQLRLLEAGKTVRTVEIDWRPFGVDVPADLEAVKSMLKPPPKA
jgi:3-deoxy-manno-octulosonate cytidylyltransferase (CMP-KDO synthetase)